MAINIVFFCTYFTGVIKAGPGIARARLPTRLSVSQNPGILLPLPTHCRVKVFPRHIPSQCFARIYFPRLPDTQIPGILVPVPARIPVLGLPDTPLGGVILS